MNFRLETRGYVFAVLCIWLLACIPIFVCDQPVLADYPNHLARIRVWLDAIDGNPSRYLAPIWALQPNLAFDLLTGLLAQFMPLELAGKIFVCLAILMVGVGPGLLNRAIAGHFSVWSLAPFLLVYNRLFFWGFVAYLFSLGLVFAVALLWVSPVRREARTGIFLARSVAAFTVLLCHLYAFGVLGILVACLVLPRLIQDKGCSIKERVGLATQELLPLLVPLPIFSAFSPSAEYASSTSFGPFFRKLEALPAPFIGPLGTLDAIVACLVVAVIGIAFFCRILKVTPLTITSVPLLLMMHLAMPDKLFSSYGADKRLPIAIAMLLFASSISVAQTKNRRLSLVLPYILLFAFAIRVVALAVHWNGFSIIHREHMAAIAMMDRDAKVLSLVGTEKPFGLPSLPITEYAAWATVNQSAFWPGIFAYPVHAAQSIKFISNSEGFFPGTGVQKIPVQKLAGIVSAQSAIGQLIADDLAPCFDFVLVASELPLDAAIGKSPLGELLFRKTHVALYLTAVQGKCLHPERVTHQLEDIYD